MEKNLEIIGGGGIQCDNCDWVDATIPVKDMEGWINLPCPKCGSNLLTIEDYNGMIMFLAAVDIVNEMDLSHLKEPGEQPTMHSVSFHNGLTIGEIDNGKQ